MAMNRASMPKQIMKPPKGAKAPKNMGGKLPAAIGKRKTNHGKMNFAAGGMIPYAKGGKAG